VWWYQGGILPSALTPTRRQGDMDPNGIHD
jgi:hypothetical protein